jgi:DNA-binding response OmpR family regulator
MRIRIDPRQRLAIHAHESVRPFPIAMSPLPDTATASAAERPLILLVDDQPEELRLLAQLLQPLYRLAHAAEPSQALSRAQALQPALVLLDVNLAADMDGYALCRLLKTDPLTRDIPVLFCSSSNTPQARILGLGMGAVDFIGKPFHPEEVLARVRVHLRLAEQIRRGPGPRVDEALVDRDPGAVLAQGAVAFIREHLGEVLTVRQIAQQVGTHEKRLLALFGQHVGQTVSGFLREERLRAGARLLAGTEMAIQEIATMVGYGNPGNFATSFRDRHGLSPLAYRSAMRTQQRAEPGANAA